MRFNLNDYVKVKLTTRGMDLLKAKHEDLFQHRPDRRWMPPEVDAQGYTRYQLWSLMQDLGQHCSMDMSPPFETEIILVPPRQMITNPAFSTWVSEQIGKMTADELVAWAERMPPRYIEDPAANWPISSDGPHEITETRRRLARYLLDSKLSDTEAFGCVRHHEDIKGA